MTVQPRIYRSDLPLTPIVRQSIFTYLMETTYHQYDPSAPAFVDADTGITLTRKKVKTLALKLGYGIRNHILLPSAVDPRSLTRLARGDTVMIFSSNTMSWPATVFACVDPRIVFSRTKLTSCPFARPVSRCLAAGLRTTYASSSLTPRELSWQWLDSKARVVFAAPHLINVVKDMFKLIGTSDEEAHRRIWVMDQLWDEGLPKGEYGTENWLGYLLHKGELDQEEKFDGDCADETAYICYSSGTTVRYLHQNSRMIGDQIPAGEAKGSRGEE